MFSFRPLALIITNPLHFHSSFGILSICVWLADTRLKPTQDEEGAPLFRPLVSTVLLQCGRENMKASLRMAFLLFRPPRGSSHDSGKRIIFFFFFGIRLELVVRCERRFRAGQQHQRKDVYAYIIKSDALLNRAS